MHNEEQADETQKNAQSEKQAERKRSKEDKRTTHRNAVLEFLINSLSLFLSVSPPRMFGASSPMRLPFLTPITCKHTLVIPRISAAGRKQGALRVFWRHRSKSNIEQNG